MWKRRVITIPIVIFLGLLVTLTAPIWILVFGILSTFRPIQGILRAGLFLWCFLWCEILGIIGALYIWLLYLVDRDTEKYRSRNLFVQGQWCVALKAVGQRLFQAQFVVTGLDALTGPDVIMIPRHSSIGDTILATVFYTFPNSKQLRHVIKKELLLDPCIDIFGNRLDNYFVERNTDDKDVEIRGIVRLLEGVRANEGVLIYPEGTRFSSTKRLKILKKLPAHLAERANRWTSLLPPRLGGLKALLQSNQKLDLLFCAHVGFEGSIGLRSMMNGGWYGRVIRIHFWRVSVSDIPKTEPGIEDFIFDSWDRMQTQVERLTKLSR